MSDLKVKAKKVSSIIATVERIFGCKLASVKNITLREIAIAFIKSLEDRGLAIDAKGGLRHSKTWMRASVDIAQLANKFALNIRKQKHVSVGMIVETLEAIIAGEAELRRDVLLAQMIGKPSKEEGRAELRRWIKAVTGTVREVDFAAMLHWLWLVKARQSGKHGAFHLMVILVGEKQGTGKSTAAMKLCEPWQELFDADICVETITDERCAPTLIKGAVGLWDELGGLARVELDRLKHRITSPEVGYRPMRTNDRNIAPMLITLIGTSNRGVAELVHDTTGARRFYELRVPGLCDWETINAIDYSLLWQAISENDEAPGKTYGMLIAAEQRNLVWRDSVQQWLDEEHFDATFCSHPANPHTGVPNDELYHRYSVWCKGHGVVRPLDAQIFGKRMRQLGWEPCRPRTPWGLRPMCLRCPTWRPPGADESPDVVKDGP